jgi:nitroimidazol reductase NimA-like FMN-containing flavoprotein (pyridoxamine 5'-phosphate oxidase superfamily)
MRHAAKSPASKVAHDAVHAEPRSSPSFRSLSSSECEKILSRNHVARIAFSFHDRVDIEPVHYVYEHGWMFGRTSPGSKLTTLAHSHWMAAEVDEVDALFDWRSVVVHGAFYTVSPDVPGAEATAWARGVELLRTLIPLTATADDPVPFRTVIFQIKVDEMIGREATPGSR